MAGVQPRTRGSITAGRPLPPRREAPMAPAANDLPPLPAPIQASVASATPAPAVVAPAVAPPAVVAAAAVERLRPSRPHAGPMRLALGAGAVAAISVMTVGFVQPDFGGESSEEPVTDQLATEIDATAVQDGQAQVRRVKRYVFLEPGEKAPRGAEVISAKRAARLGLSPGPETDGARSPTNPAPVRNPAPADNPNPPAARAPEPAPPEPPRVTTRQSGG